ncbi:DUF938 domain-containing protein [Ideonella sp. BN130291]|uniref:DUF938 domain-containing protein n=1 Tax=Ideonella sp. BN130291 TaxID=3112940 RepID=UPI002E266106|nr:DUF938 domain-containing protein [Ideonella sp. BN130291]
MTARLYSAAAERNRHPILEQLQRLLPPRGHALEIASGTGQHVAHFAAGLPAWQWQPSDRHAEGFASIVDWCAGLANVAAPCVVDVTAPVWPVGEVDAIYCANMLHASPWATCAGLVDGANRHLARAGLLITYGPYRVGGAHTAASNAEFDADLRARDPAWGVRDLEAVEQAARRAGLQLRERIAMPSNNQLLVFTRAADCM